MTGARNLSAEITEKEEGEKGRKKGHAEVRDLGPAISGRSPRVDPYKASATLASGNPA